MVNVPVIAKRELNTYFLSPIAYVVLTGFALADGLLFSPMLQPAINPSEAVQGVFWVAAWLLILGVPVLTMRLLSEETSAGTIETLMTTPVTEAEVVLGKLAGALFFSLVLFVPIVAQVVLLALLGETDSGPMLSGFLGLFLLAAQFISVGMLYSALTRIQIASAIMSFVTLLGMFFLWLLSRDATTTLAGILRYVSPPWHYMGFARGIVDTRDLAYFGITTVVFVFLTVKALELRKWR
jgi:ABC-2 type transport system permease protein